MTPIAPLKILKASAGSGKTFSLTLHYLSLLLSNENSYREILAVTFTNKATAEMKERILSVLHALAIGDTNNTKDVLRILLQNNPTWTSQSIQKAAHRVYRRILHDYSHFTISTIDGFSQKVIRSFTYELNLDAAYKIEMNTNKVKADLTNMLNQLLDERPDLLEWIIDFAEKKINNNENWNYRQQLLNLANLIFSENFLEFENNLIALNSAEVFHLLDKDITAYTQTFIGAVQDAVESFRDTCKQYQIEDADLKGKSRNKLISLQKSKIVIKKLSLKDLEEYINKYTTLIGDEDSFTDSKKAFRQDIYTALNPILQQFVSIEKLLPYYIAYQSVEKNLYYLRLIQEMSQLLAIWRKEHGAQLISDSQLLLNKLGLDKNDDPTFIWEKIGNRYNYFLFDEFQDTSRVQWKNYSPLLLNALGNSGGEQHEHLIVGDVKQSIYRWRNGDWRILLQHVEEQVAAKFHLKKDQLDILVKNDVLDTNFRSLPNIIRFNNYIYEKLPAIIQQLLNQKVTKELGEPASQWWIKDGNDSMLLRAYANAAQEIPPHKIDREDRQGSIEIKYYPVENNKYRSSQVAEESLNDLCLKIGEWISSKRYQANQIGILVRSNKQALQVIQALMKYKNASGIDFDVISGDALSLNANDAILLIIETLKAIVFNSPKHVVLHARMAYLYQLIRSGDSFDDAYWMLFKENDMQSLTEILPAALTEHWQEFQKLPLIHSVEKLIEIYGFTDDNNVHLPYLLTFKDIVGNFTANGERGINQFIEFWEEDGNKAVLPSGGKSHAIEVSTIHKSKGLAYDVVMIPFCSWDLDGKLNGEFWVDTVDTPFAQLKKIPINYNSALAKSVFSKQYYEEMLFNYMDALNTFYVATTRAKEHLYITAPTYNLKEDKKKPGDAEVRNDYISDVLYQILEIAPVPFRLVENELAIDQIISRTKDSEEGINKQIIALQHYPISKTMEQALNKVNKRTINTILRLEKAAQYGTLAHEVMAEAAKKEDIDRIIKRYIQEGILAEENKELLLVEINNIWQHPQVNKWLKGDYKIWNEAAIILADGSTMRPDKVFTNDEETIVLDFKFTADNYIEHKTQVAQYMTALESLGYVHVKGYLFYAKSNHLQEVK